MEVKFTALSEIGHVRAHNEDSYGIAENTPNGSIYVVCDGMGGHVGGATASRLAVDSILEYFKKEKYDNLILEIDKAFQFANEQIFAHTLAEPQLKGMGTTAVVLIIKKEDCYIGHVGDSRIYIKSDTKLHRLTKDHSFVQGLVDSGVISDDEAEKHPQKNQILKALGHTSDVKGTICKKPFKVKAGDVFLLCTDGLNGMINDSFIENTINGNDLEKSKKDLFEAAMANGGLDNVTILLVQITQSKFHGRNDFKSYNPIEKGRGQEDNFDKTSGLFSKTQQIDHSQRPATKKKKWIPYLFYGSVGTLALILSLFFIFRKGEANSKQEKTLATKMDGNQDVGITSNELAAMTLEELNDLAYKKALLDDNISNGVEITISDGKIVVLTIVDRRLIAVSEKNKTIAVNPEITETSIQNSTTIERNDIKESKNNNIQSTKPINSNSDFVPVEGQQGVYKIQTQKGGETITQLLTRIKNNPNKFPCQKYPTVEQTINLNKSNPDRETKIEYQKLKTNESIVLKGIWIWVKCE